MISADEMFEKLGYVSCRDESNIYYNKRLDNCFLQVIQFNEEDEKVEVYLENSSGIFMYNPSLTIFEFVAIARKIIQLQWF